MIIIIPPQHHCQNRSLIEESFRVRYEVFIEELGWKIPGVQDGIERDQYDIPQTYYLMKLDEEGKVIAGARFLNTNSNFLLRDVFADLVDANHQPLLTCKTFWECSRLFVSTRFRKQNTREAVRGLLCEVMLGILSFGFYMKIPGYLVVVEKRIGSLYESMGWPLVSIGPEKLDNDTTIFAANMLIKREFYNNVLQNYKHYSGCAEKEEFIQNVEVLDKESNKKKARL